MWKVYDLLKVFKGSNPNLIIMSIFSSNVARKSLQPFFRILPVRNLHIFRCTMTINCICSPLVYLVFHSMHFTRQRVNGAGFTRWNICHNRPSSKHAALLLRPSAIICRYCGEFHNLSRTTLHWPRQYTTFLLYKKYECMLNFCIFGCKANSWLPW